MRGGISAGYDRDLAGLQLGEDHVSPVFKDYTCFAVAAVLSHQAVETIVTDSKRPS